MEKKNLLERYFNNKYSLITKQSCNIEGFDSFYGDIQKAYLNIRKKELEEDKLYLGHIIINSKEIEVNKELLSKITNNSLSDKSFYAYDILHDGVDSVCNINDDIVFCSSWTLPFYVFNYRTSNTLYGDIFARRLDMYKLEI